jgi:hypothetical protein
MTTTPKGFLKLDRAIVYGEAFAGLSANATRLLIAIWARYNGRNNGNIHYGISDAVKWLHCGRSTAVKTFVELRDAGLIEVGKAATFADKAGAQNGTTTAWRLPHIKGGRTPSENSEHGSREQHRTGPESNITPLPRVPRATL